MDVMVGGRMGWLVDVRGVGRVVMRVMIWGVVNGVFLDWVDNMVLYKLVSVFLGRVKVVLIIWVRVLWESFLRVVVFLGRVDYIIVDDVLERGRKVIGLVGRKCWKVVVLG